MDNGFFAFFASVFFPKNNPKKDQEQKMTNQNVRHCKTFPKNSESNFLI